MSHLVKVLLPNITYYLFPNIIFHLENSINFKLGGRYFQKHFPRQKSSLRRPIKMTAAADDLDYNPFYQALQVFSLSANDVDLYIVGYKISYCKIQRDQVTVLKETLNIARMKFAIQTHCCVKHLCTDANVDEVNIL